MCAPVTHGVVFIFSVAEKSSLVITLSNKEEAGVNNADI
jgi:hypothetical protein